MIISTVIGTITNLLILVLVVWIYEKIIKRIKRELKQKQEFIDKYLLVVKFPSQFYVFLYVSGTKQQKVFYCTSHPLSSATPTFAIVDAEEARRRITLEHHAHMEELDRLGV